MLQLSHVPRGCGTPLRVPVSCTDPALLHLYHIAVLWDQQQWLARGQDTSYAEARGVVWWWFLITVLLTRVPGFFGVFQKWSHSVVLSHNVPYARCGQSEKERLERVSTWSSTWGCLEKVLWTFRRSLPFSTVVFLFIFWGGQSYKSFPEKSARAAMLTRHVGRMRVFVVVFVTSSTKFHVLNLHTFSLNFLAYKGSTELYKRATEYGHIYFEIYFAGY